ncbi:CMP/dCMP deaminase zinc-binding protein [Chondrocystis sp. NIES-4102]|nr:CMP/dCMP deaminase zinc-binding protein [Chondrocystis sp. NIES-4102]
MAKKLHSRYQNIKQSLSKLDDNSYINHCHWLEYALKLANLAADAGEVPIGAIIVDNLGNLLAEATNRKERDLDATAHAEILAIRMATALQKNYYLPNCTLYVTLEPCPMCAGAIIQSRLGLLVYGADDPKTGAIRTVMNLPDSACSNHKLQVLAGIKELECRQQLQNWFEHRRNSQGRAN